MTLASLKWITFVITVVVFLALLPQIRFWIARGHQWHGAYVVSQPDELKYSAYVNALIDGRPRRTDPSAGQDDNPVAPLPESLFSIQFVPAYAVALPARIFGISAATAFIAVLAIESLLAAISIYILLVSTMNDRRFAAAATLFVLAFGALAGGQGVVGLLAKSDVRFLGMPFLRRYEPGFPFSFFFFYCVLIWHALQTSIARRADFFAILASITFVVLIFSYLYLWTAAGVYLMCIVGLWFFLRPDERRRTIRIFIVANIPALIALPIYAVLLSHVPRALDKAQALTLTHRPDFVRFPEVIGFILLIIIVVRIRQDRLASSDPRTLFTIAIALMPFVLFNQQIMTGRSIQPYHYEVLVLSYTSLIGIVSTLTLLRFEVSRGIALTVIVASLFWGVLETYTPFQSHYKYDLAHDEMVPVLLRLKDLSMKDGTFGTNRRGAGIVFSPVYQLSTVLPTWAPQGSLLAPASFGFQSLSTEEATERLYDFLYYDGKDEEYLRTLLTDRAQDPLFSDFAKSALFGPERVLPFIAVNYQPIANDEIEESVRKYRRYIAAFSRSQATKRTLAYGITPSDESFDFSRIDKWYERDQGEHVGKYSLFKLTPR